MVVTIKIQLTSNGKFYATGPRSYFDNFLPTSLPHMSDFHSVLCTRHNLMHSHSGMSGCTLLRILQRHKLYKEHTRGNGVIIRTAVID